MCTQTWTVAEAKAKFSELLDKANSEGPQRITKHGRTIAVVVAAEEWDRKADRKGNLAEFLARSPLRGRVSSFGVSQCACGKSNDEFSFGQECPI
jgi:prevent-host-death family protein